MKKLLLILLCLPMIGFGQQTYVPDDNFEQALINMGYDNVLDDYVITANINTVTSLSVGLFNSIADLTGIEDFAALTYLNCDNNQLTSLDVSQNTVLTNLWCRDNQLTSLAISTALIELYCADNQLVILDVSSASSLQYFNCEDNQLASLDLRNGNNLSSFHCSNNPNLYCINVDDVALSTALWTVVNGNIDAQHYFSNNCPPSAIQEHTTNKELLKITNLLGRETKQTNEPFFYIYDDGTVEKRIVIE